MPIIINSPEFYERYRAQIEYIRKLNMAKLLFSLGCFVCCIAMSIMFVFYNLAYIIIPYIGSVIVSILFMQPSNYCRKLKANESVFCILFLKKFF